jgi:hypothetical protein
MAVYKHFIVYEYIRLARYLMLLIDSILSRISKYYKYTPLKKKCIKTA